ncbi:DUF2855 family protein [Halopseudomonas sp.]|uniref:DUF2855 family protein n=1 Tax=Halopseudomonas sp. TaxID=2901191 RepID=UPI003002C5A6|tara:strand:+ start:1279 stop:2394 length:1116 start_codon:yes stop_codon:yes gene_type:complete
MTTTCTRLLVNKGNIHECTLQEVPRLQEQDLQDGEVLLDIDHFAFTANNITYATLGDRFGYWDFFPAEAPWGQVPVWGFADVSASRHPDIAVGTRVYGYLPMAGQLRVRPGNLTASSFTDMAEHRSHLALAYNQYQFTAADPAYRPELEALQMLLRPLLLTSFLLDDFLHEHHYFSAEQIILTSASSKTALGLAFMLNHQRSVRAGKPQRIVALTSAANAKFVSGLGYYDQTIAYDQLDEIDASKPSVLIDFAGNGTLLAEVHQRLEGNLKFSSLVGAAHWDQRKGEKNLPGAKPEVFFAPGYWAQRNKELGATELIGRFARLWAPLAQSVGSWMEIKTAQGVEAMMQAYTDTLNGLIKPETGMIMRTHSK